MAKGLGKGLSALFGDSEYNNGFEKNNEEKVEKPKEIKIGASKESSDDKIQNKIVVDSIDAFEQNNKSNEIIKEVKLTEIEPNPTQARKHFNQEKLNELSESIKTFGVLQPIIVAKKDDHYEIIAGERRWRASKLAGLTTIPAIVKRDKVADNANISIIENIQRENLNAIEKAKGYQELISKFNYEVEDLSSLLSKSVYTIRESLDLLNLDPRVIDLVEKAQLPQSVCKTLLEIKDNDLQHEAALYIVEDGLTVKEAQNRLKLSARRSVKKQPVVLDPIFKEVEDKFTNYFGTRAKLKVNSKNLNSGQIILKYTSNKELERMMDILENNEF